MHKINRSPFRGSANHSSLFCSLSSLPLESLSLLFFFSPFLNPEIKSHMAMRTIPTARKLTVPIFLKKSEKLSIVSIFFSQYHFHGPNVNSYFLQKITPRVVIVKRTDTTSCCLEG
jgi:hypothetical protein